MVGTGVLVRTYCLHLPSASEDRPTMLLQNIHSHVPGYTVFQPRPHYESSPVSAPQTLYQRIARTSETWVEMSNWENWTAGSAVWFLNTQYLIPHSFPPTVYAFLKSCLSNELRKWGLEHFLVTNIISTNTHFGVSSTKMISQGQSHTQNHSQCWMCLK
jgi:hypothetical protein